MGSEMCIRDSKKDELIRLLLEARESGSSSITGSAAPDNSSPTHSSLGRDVDLDWLSAKIKNAVVEAVYDIRAELKAEYESMLKDARGKFSEELNSLRSEVKNLKERMDTQTRTIETEFFHDMRDSESRRSNIMIFGMKESTSPSLAECKEYDWRSIENLASELGVHDFQVSDFFCLGRRGDKPRPIKVRCRKLQQRNDLLRIAPRILRLDENLGYRGIFIKPDLSPKEQEANRILREELRRRREAGERVVIRGGRVIPDTRSSEVNRD